jgi:hypothetical protein
MLSSLVVSFEIIDLGFLDCKIVWDLKSKICQKKSFQPMKISSEFTKINLYVLIITRYWKTNVKSNQTKKNSKEDHFKNYSILKNISEYKSNFIMMFSSYFKAV